jgi:hypothetical protein
MALKPQLRPKANGSGHTNRYISSCSACRLGIYDQADAVWSRRPLGLIHTACAPASPGGAA